jgi:hypothetical protein
VMTVLRMLLLLLGAFGLGICFSGLIEERR